MLKIEYRKLCSAIAESDLDAAEREISRNPAAVSHWKPLIDAAFFGRAEFIDLLLKAGADPNVKARTASKHTPLTRVTQHHKTIPKHDGHVAALRLLLDNGSDPKIPGGPLQLTPLTYATMGPEMRFIDVLRTRYEPFNVFHASVLLDTKRLKNLDLSLSENEVDTRGRSPLHYCALSGMWRELGSNISVDCAKHLVSAGEDVDAVEEIQDGSEIFSATPLWYSISYAENIELASYLLSEGADPSPAVFSATFVGRKDFVELLDRYGADWNQRFDGSTPLMDLLTYRRSALVPWLLEHGADVSATDKKGRTPLHIAAEMGINTECIGVLLANGADLSAEDLDGNTPLDLAIKRKRKKAIEFLERLA